jgi:hypothetical protein
MSDSLLNRSRRGGAFWLSVQVAGVAYRSFLGATFLADLYSVRLSRRCA